MEVKKERQLQFYRTASQENKRFSLKEPYSMPFGSSDQGAKEQKGDTSPGRNSPLSQDSVFSSSQLYDVPANSKRLQKLNATLPRGPAPDVSGYARLDLSREAILLRSGVTLRRYSRGESVSSILSIMSKRGESIDDGSDGSSGEGGTEEHDDGLEPVHKYIQQSVFVAVPACGCTCKYVLLLLDNMVL